MTATTLMVKVVSVSLLDQSSGWVRESGRTSGVSIATQRSLSDSTPLSPDESFNPGEEEDDIAEE